MFDRGVVNIEYSLGIRYTRFDQPRAYNVNSKHLVKSIWHFLRLEIAVGSPSVGGSDE